MHLRLIAVGERQPDWVEDAFQDYVARLPKAWKFRLDAVSTAKRFKSGSVQQAMEAEGRLILDQIRPTDCVVVLDERGKGLTTVQLEQQLADWLAGGRDLCFVIGGPDGLSGEVKKRANSTWSLSKLTLPHGMVRVLLAEQLFRAWSMSTNHPYHRT
jgi:23S rRNA (pseudouridine1915-N3)-methyltransferase